MQTGIGNCRAGLRVYIANRPPMAAFESLTAVRPLVPGEVASIVAATSNHWRKIFNLYAKLAFAVTETESPSWQHYRDNHLLQAGSNELLLFSPPELTGDKTVHIVSGHSYAKQLGANQLGLGELPPADDGFLMDAKQRLIVSPYFDYRQLSNAKLAVLVGLVKACRSDFSPTEL